MNKDFKTLFVTQFLGAFNDNIFKNALVILITFNSVTLFGLDAKLLVPLAGGLFIFPFFIFSGTAGQLADRFRKKRLIQFIKLLEILIMLLGSLAFYQQSYHLLFLTLFLMGGQSAFFGPLKYGIVPELVETNKLVTANAYISAGTFIAILLGTILGGYLASLTDGARFLMMTILSVAFLGWLSSLQFKRHEGSFLKRHDVLVDYTLVRSTWTILRDSMSDKKTLIMILQISWFWLVGAAVLSLLPLMVKESLRAGSEMATFFLALFTVGMGLGSFITQKLSQEKAQLGFVPISALGIGVTLLTCYVSLLTSNVVMCSLSVLVMAAFGGGFMVTLITAIQESTDQVRLSRIIAGNNIWNALFMVVAAFMVMVLTSMFSIEGAVLFFAVFCLFSSLIFYCGSTEESIRQWKRLGARLLYHIEVDGEDNVPREGAVILVANHVSFVDWLVLSAVIKRPIRYVIDWSYYYLPTLPFWFKQAKLIPIATKKESAEVLEKAFSKMSESINEGAVLGIFAEGWLSRDGQLRPLQPGVNRLLKDHPVPVVLVAIDGLWGSFFSHSGRGVFRQLPTLKRRRLKITISKVIKASDYKRKEARQWFIKNVSHYDE